MSEFAERTTKDAVETGTALAPKFDADGLLPVVATDYRSGEVLMLAYMNAEALKKTMADVREFCFDHGLFGDANSKDFVGIAFPDKSILGDANNVKLRFDLDYMQMAADGKL